MNNIKALHACISCPRCSSADMSFNNSSISCRTCNTAFEIIDTIPSFLPPHLKHQAQKVQKAFEYKWKLLKTADVTQDSYIIDDTAKKTIIPVKLQACDENWIALTKKEFNITEQDVRGKTVLDIGTGFGRLAYVMNALGAKHIYCFDICRSGMKQALQDLAGQTNVTFLQATIDAMPFRMKSFDIVISWGVFHHTSNTEEAFRKGAKLVKPGGLMLVHLYETSDPRRLRYTNRLRALIQTFPLPMQYWICKHLLTIRDWSVFNRNDAWGKLLLYLHKRIMFGNNPIGTFDCYSPKYNHTHTDDEIISWYKSEGFDTVEVVNKELHDPHFSPEINRVLQKENGKHGGFLLIKGKKSYNNTIEACACMYS